MGKKADRLEEELDLTQAELRAERQRSTELEDDLIKAGLRPPRATPGAQGYQTVYPSDNAATSANALARREVHNDGTAVGVYPGSSLDGGTDDADEAIRQLRRAPPPVEKEESLLDIVQANNREREHLNESQRLANALISRIASALQVSRWNQDGAEILEKAQRFSIFHHWLSRRLKGLIVETPPIDHLTDQVSVQRSARIAELRTVISALVAGPQLSKFLHERLGPAAAAPPSIFDTANDADPAIGTATRSDILALRDAFAVYTAERGVPMPAWLASVVKFEDATNVLVDLLNLVLLPTLVRMKLVTR